MHSKRVLLVTDDPFLGRFYRSKLERSGFSVDVAESVSAGASHFQASRPDLAVVDPLLRDPAGLDGVEVLRGLPQGGAVPMLALPTPHFSVAQRMGSYPGVRLLTREASPLGELIKVASEVLGLPAHDGMSLMLATQPDDDWKQQAIAAAQASVAEMRQGLHQLSRETDASKALPAMLKAVHHFAGQTTLLNRAALSHLARAVESLVYALGRIAAETVDPLTLRTLGQAVDFMALLLEDRRSVQLPEINGAHIIIIEDEASALELIITSMEMVGLQAAGAEAPNKGLALLSSTPCDLIFLDINLPEMNGFELCNKVRALPLHERTPIVFLTGMNSFQNRVQGSLSGGNDFVGKPFNVAELGVKALIWVMKGRLGLN